MISFSHVVRKWTGSYKFSKSQEKIDYFMYEDDIKVFSKKKKKEKKEMKKNKRLI